MKTSDRVANVVCLGWVGLVPRNEQTSAGDSVPVIFAHRGCTREIKRSTGQNPPCKDRYLRSIVIILHVVLPIRRLRPSLESAFSRNKYLVESRVIYMTLGVIVITSCELALQCILFLSEPHLMKQGHELFFLCVPIFCWYPAR